MLSLPLTSGPSFTSVTVTVTGREAVLKASSLAWTVTSYTLSPPESARASKFGGFVKDKTPLSSIVKKDASTPAFNHVIVPRSGSVAR